MSGVEPTILYEHATRVRQSVANYELVVGTKVPGVLYRLWAHVDRAFPEQARGELVRLADGVKMAALSPAEVNACFDYDPLVKAPEVHDFTALWNAVEPVVAADLAGMVSIEVVDRNMEPEALIASIRELWPEQADRGTLREVERLIRETA